jgi:hypothetical protein
MPRLCLCAGPAQQSAGRSRRLRRAAAHLMRRSARATNARSRAPGARSTATFGSAPWLSKSSTGTSQRTGWRGSSGQLASPGTDGNAKEYALTCGACPPPPQGRPAACPALPHSCQVSRRRARAAGRRSRRAVSPSGRARAAPRPSRAQIPAAGRARPPAPPAAPRAPPASRSPRLAAHQREHGRATRGGCVSRRRRARGAAPHAARPHAPRAAPARAQAGSAWRCSCCTSRRTRCACPTTSAPSASACWCEYPHPTLPYRPGACA